jgi:hypothetical protein
VVVESEEPLVADRLRPSRRIVRLARWFAAALLIIAPSVAVLTGFGSTIEVLLVGLVIAGVCGALWFRRRAAGSASPVGLVDRPLGILALFALAIMLLPQAATNVLFRHEPPFGDASWIALLLSIGAIPVVAFRVVRDVGLALAGRSARLRANARQHGALLVLIAATWVLGATMIGMRVNFVLQKDSIASTFASVETRCAAPPNPTAEVLPRPLFRGRAVADFVCAPDQVRFTVRSWSGFLEGGSWGFVRLRSAGTPKPLSTEYFRKLDRNTWYWFSKTPFD